MSKLKKPEIKKASMDSLFMLEGTDGAGLSSVSVNELVPFENHPFETYAYERLCDLAESIKANGVITPIIVRLRDDGVKEIISGHNRVKASKMVKIEEIPAVLLKDLSDEKALAYVIETNLMQRSFAEMRHTEKAAVLTLHHSKLFSQGKRTDIINELKRLENLGKESPDESETISHDEKKIRSNAEVGKQYSLSASHVSRYLRIQFLIEEFKQMLDANTLTFVPAVEISFLPEPEQRMIAECAERNGLTIGGKESKMLRAFFAQGELNGENIYKILSGNMKPKTEKKTPVVVKPDVYEKYFTEEQSPEEISDIIKQALDLWFSDPIG